MWDPGDVLASLRSLSLTQEQWEDVTYKNALRVFGAFPA
jgi:predicted TIM-barrel fold metal-dependent hydrolase